MKHLVRAARCLSFAAAVALLPIMVGSVVFPVSAHAQDQARWKRLILKDGSYQLVTKYEVKGDRVRYFSAERMAWEEVPKSLVDWDATEKWNKTHKPGAAAPDVDQEPNVNAAPSPHAQEEAKEIDKEAAAARADLAARTPLVATDLHLPDENGVFVLDEFQGIPELIHLDQRQGNVNRDPNHNVLRAVISSFHGAQEPVRIYGQAAAVRLHVDDPTFYVSVDTQGEQQQAESAMVVDTHGLSSKDDKNQASSPDSRYSIVRVDVRPGERVIGALRISRIEGLRQDVDIVPTNVQILPGKHWMKLTPKQPLEVGEYALMEILGPGVINLDVWDFGVSPNAPENRHVLTPIHTSR
jgi:hypothetical protein